MSRHSSSRGDRSCCSEPSEPPKLIYLPDGTMKIVFPPGEMKGELRPFRDQTTHVVHQIECVCVGGDDGGQKRPIPLESFLDAIHTAAYLGVKLSTLYAWAPFLESTDKRGSRLIFWTEILVNQDIPELENRLPHRADLANERVDRVLSGEVVRRGRHAVGCLKNHEGPCNRPPRPDGPRHRSRKWLRGLGKGKKK
jgi:hypothetical protein